MRIAIPVKGDCLDEHFGHCEKFLLFDVDLANRAIGSVSEVEAPEHQPGLLPGWLKECGVTLIIAGGIGAHARSLCAQLSIKVVAGAPQEAAQVLAQRYLDGTLVASDRPCEHH